MSVWSGVECVAMGKGLVVYEPEGDNTFTVAVKGKGREAVTSVSVEDVAVIQ